MMKTLKMGLLGLALGVASAVVLPSQVAMAGSGPAPGNPPKPPPSACQLRKTLCLIENAGNPLGGLICTALYGNC
ncbi:hypothetical protein F0U62_13620 [Cystobacter fuscus]|uniref:hypothetical protein n=1 Tax=Cystobacter fuscus TaxID=43 RepID=UPI002B31BEA6|nr:hypothetical protein F0U62_13620 [Cystobacter fuscus]